MIFILSVSFGISQKCGNHYIPIKKIPKKYYEKYRTKAPVANLNLRIIAVQDHNGNNGISDSDIEYLKTNLTNAFSEVCTFEYCVIKPKNSSLLYSPGPPYMYAHDNALNLMIVPNVPSSYNIGGIADISAVAAWGGKTNNSVTAIHEVGHLLGLKHTFQQRIETDDMTGDIVLDDNGDEVIIFENAERDLNSVTEFDYPNSNLTYPCANCDEEGDGICDTPADRNPFAGCGSYSSVPVDHCGFRLKDQDNLDVLDTNYMTYGNWSCSSIFTDGQKAEMSATIVMNHQDRTAGSEPNFNATEITTGGQYFWTGGKYVIFHDITIDEDFYLGQMAGQYSLGVAPGVTITIENGGSLRPYESIIELYDGPYPLCHDGPINGDSWKGVVVNSGGQVFLYGSSLEDADEPITCNGCDAVVTLRSTFTNYKSYAISAVGAQGLVGILESSFITPPFFNSKSVIVNDCSRFQFSESTLVGSGRDKGFSIKNTPALFDRDSQISSCRQGICVEGGSLSVQRCNISNCTDYGVLADGANSAHIVNSVITNCSGDNTRYEAVNIDNTPDHEIRNNEFASCAYGAIGVNGVSGSENSIMNNIINGASSKAFLVEGEQFGLRYFCNAFNGSANANIAMSGIPAFDQGYFDSDMYLSATNFFSNSISNDLAGPGESMVTYYHTTDPVEIPNRINTNLNERVDNRIEECAPGPQGLVPEDDDPDDLFDPNPDDVVITGDPLEDDTDGDGDPNYSDPDDDNDGIPDEEDDDDDNDGIPDHEDPDWCPPYMVCSDIDKDKATNKWKNQYEYRRELLQTMEQQINASLHGPNLNLANQIAHMTMSDRADIIRLINKGTPYISPETFVSMLYKSAYFYESDIVDVITTNPDLMYDHAIRKYILGSDDFSLNSHAKINESLGNRTELTNKYAELNSMKMKIGALTRKIQNRHILFGEEYKNGMTRNRTKGDALPEELRFREEASLTFDLFPNPTSGIIYIINPFQQSCNLIIRDIAGNMVLKSAISGLAQKDLSYFEPGVYIVSLENLSNGVVLDKKIIITE